MRFCNDRIHDRGNYEPDKEAFLTLLFLHHMEQYADMDLLLAEADICSVFSA